MSDDYLVSADVMHSTASALGASLPSLQVQLHAVHAGHVAQGECAPMLPGESAVETPPPLWRAALDTIRALAGVLHVALFTRQDTGWRLAWSDTIEQRDLDVMAQLDPRAWSILDAGGALTLGERFVIPCHADGRCGGVVVLHPIPEPDALPRRYLPLLGELLALGLDPTARPARHEAAPAIARDWSAEAEGLVTLLERHEWNVSFVARVLRVTRMTVYNRLRRFKIPRRVVRKPPRQRRRKPREAQPRVTAVSPR